MIAAPPKLRRPPSVLVSYYNARHANQTRTLADELIHQVGAKIVIFEAAVRENRRVQEFNPACEYRRDELTDRWPATAHDQRVFLDELVNFSTKLHRLKRGAPLDVMQEILSDLFGEKPTGAAIEQQVRQRVTDRNAGVSLFVPRTAASRLWGRWPRRPSPARLRATRSSETDVHDTPLRPAAGPRHQNAASDFPAVSRHGLDRSLGGHHLSDRAAVPRPRHLLLEIGRAHV